MKAPAKLGAFGVVLAVALGGGAAIGSAVGPVDVAERSGAGHDVHQDPEASSTDGAEGTEEEEASMPGGVLTSQAGYTFEADDIEVDGTAGAPFRFRILGPDGSVVRDFEPRHERELHLIVVGSDLGSFAHLHPSRGGEGTWTVDLPRLAPGVYRAFADFAPVGGPDLTLGVDLAVPGSFRPAPLPEVAATDVVDGYEVTLSGTPMARSASDVTLTVTRDGEPVEDLEPYLGAFGHLVAIRAGDLAYLHVHPLDEGGGPGGPAVRFAVEVPSAGDFRLFFDFAHDGEVRTAAFTVAVPTGGQPTAATDGHGTDGGHGAAGTEEGR